MRGLGAEMTTREFVLSLGGLCGVVPGVQGESGRRVHHRFLVCVLGDVQPERQQPTRGRSLLWAGVFVLGLAGRIR